MTDPKKPVSMTKNGGSATLAPRPKNALYAVWAMGGAVVLGIVASAIIYTQKHYLYVNALKAARKTNDSAKAKDKKTAAELVTQAHQSVAATQKSVVIAMIITALVLGFIGYGVYRGRHWSRMATIGVWFLLSFTGSVVGLFSLLQIASSIPTGYKVFAFLASLSMGAAVFFTNTKPAAAWFALSKPAAPAGARPRGGLFGPRPAAPANKTDAKTTPTARERAADGAAATEIAADRARSKKRANAASVAKGADLARTRAKAASKSRRTEV